MFPFNRQVRMSHRPAHPQQQDPDDNLDAYIHHGAYESNIPRSNVNASTYRSTRQSEAAAGRARLSLPPAITANDEFDDYSPVTTHPHVHNEFELASYQQFVPQETSSSPGHATSSSPTMRASQRQQNVNTTLPPEPADLARADTRHSSVQNTPVVQGIQLVPVHKLPDRFRTIFPFNMFNAVQSKCFASMFSCDDNIVISSPTGSGKTVLFELAICRLIHGRQNGTFKIVYMAPTKSLCSERSRDWKAKFQAFGFQCEELTGDSDISSLHQVQKADIIVTTPEKWDSMTRKWKDHEKLVRLIKLLLIDEVHILNKDRGAALEVVVSRMKSIGSGTRFVALSATVPNSQDIATWLGRNDDTPNIPAIHKRFGEEFRPVELKRNVCGYQSGANPFGFDAILTKKLPEVISRYSQRKPIMVFCFTRKSCMETATFLAKWWHASAAQNRFWSAPTRPVHVEDKELSSLVSAGVAVHHAGISQIDRSMVEKSYISGELNVICCTSTLAVGVNLPCHMVILKNTVSYEANAVKEYSDLEIMQMIGRAGRPQFDTSALAVIMTRLQQVEHYQQLLSGQERLESCLHLNLVEHLNAEIGLGTVSDLPAAKKWLAGTFLKVRLEDNPSHYRIEGDAPELNLIARLEQICTKSISHLERLSLVDTEPRFRCTQYGDAMARYYMSISTMELIMGLPARPKISDLLSMISQAHEFREVRFRAGEKLVYKGLNEQPGIRFPIKVDLSSAAHKVSLVLQSVLGDVTHVADMPKHRTQYNMDQFLVFQHVHRLIRCIVDCQNFSNDAVGIRNSLMLSRSLAAKVWDDSPMVLRQIEQVGPVTLRKLVGANISTFEELDNTDPGRLELVLGKASPFGWNLIKRVRLFPKLRVGLKMIGEATMVAGQHVSVKMKVDFGFMNEKSPTHYRGKPVYVILLVGTSDGRKMSFLRISGQKLDQVSPVDVTVTLTSPTQLVECYAMCDDLAGTMQQAMHSPNVQASFFQSIKAKAADDTNDRRGAPSRFSGISSTVGEDWGDGGINDNDLADAEPSQDDFMDIDSISNTTRTQSGETYGQSLQNDDETIARANPESQKLDNGNFACNHACKDKNTCKHMCCKEGMKKKPKPRKTKEPDLSTTSQRSRMPITGTPNRTQTKLALQPMKKRSEGPVEHVDLSQTWTARDAKPSAIATQLASLHDRTTKSIDLSAESYPIMTREAFRKPDFLTNKLDLTSTVSNEDFGDDMFPEEPLTRLRKDVPEDMLLVDEDEYLDQDEDMLDAALVGLDDSQTLLSDTVSGEAVSPYSATASFDTKRPQAKPTAEHEILVAQDQAEEDVFMGIESNETLFEDVKSDAREEDGACSNYLSTAKPRMVVEERRPFHTVASSTNEYDFNHDDVTLHDEQVDEQVGSSPNRQHEELREWLAAQLGDSVELMLE